MSYQINTLVEQIGQTHFEGNIMPMEWFQHIKFDNGKPDTNAILLLSDIVYWYRPSIVRDEHSGRVIAYKKKFKADLLQRSYSDYEDLFGYSKKQIRDCFIRLENLRLIRRVFRTIETSAGPQSNVMFIEVNPARIAEITYKLPPSNFKVTTPLHKSYDHLTLKERGHDKEVKTYTETNSEINTQTNSRNLARVDETIISYDLDDQGDELVSGSQGREDQDLFSLTEQSIDCLQRNALLEVDLQAFQFSGSGYPNLGFNPREGLPLSKQGQNPSGFAQTATGSTIPTPKLSSDLVLDSAFSFPKPEFPGLAKLQTMVAMWNEIVRRDESPVELTPERMPTLSKRLVDCFAEKLPLWEDYCRVIANSSFLMGQGERGWKATLDWALEPSNISKVLEGNYGLYADSNVKDQHALSPSFDLESVHPKWAKVCKQLIEAIGLPKFNSWISQLVPESLESSKPILKASSIFMKTQIERNYLELITNVFKQIDPQIKEVCISYSGEPA